MAFKLSLEQFEGPLDLMLHLIKEQRLDIFDLDMEILTDQYLAYLEAIEDMHLEIEGEYLLELATLIEYKSRKLLPKKSEDVVEEDDPKEILIKRLLEYQRFKEVAQELNESYIKRQENLAKSASFEAFINNEDDDNNRVDGHSYDLYKAMLRVLKRAQLSKPLVTSLKTKELSIDDQILHIKARLIDLPSTFTFDDLCNDCQNLNEYIVSFLALLELAKEHVLYFDVDEDEVIWLKKVGNNSEYSSWN